jgi:hypothetical protein
MKRIILIIAGFCWMQLLLAQWNPDHALNPDRAPAPPDDSFVLRPDTLWFITGNDFIDGKDFHIVNTHNYTIDIQHIDNFGEPCTNCIAWYTTPNYPLFPVTIPAGDSLTMHVQFFVIDYSSPVVVYDTLKVNTNGNSGQVIIAVDSMMILIGVAEPGLEKIVAAPNPFSDRLKIQIVARGEIPAKVMIYNALMQPVREIFTGMVSPGNNGFLWDGCDSNGAEVGDGIYFISFKTANGQKTLKVVKV